MQNLQTMLKDNKIIIAIVMVVILLFGGGYFIMGMRSSQPAQQQANTDEEQVVQTLSPEAIGLDFQFRKDGNAAKLIIGKAAGIRSIEYQLSYQKNLNGEEVPEGLIGDIVITGESSVETEYREFGTCSSGVCRYDDVTSPIKVTLKITKEDGKVYQVEKSFDLPK